MIIVSETYLINAKRAKLGPGCYTRQKHRLSWQTNENCFSRHSNLNCVSLHNTCALKVRKKLIFFFTCEGGSADHHLLIPSRVENLAYLYTKVDIRFVSGHERVGPHGFSHSLTPR